MKKYLFASIASLIGFSLSSSLSYAQVSFTDVNTGVGNLGGLIRNFNSTVVSAVAVLFLSAGVVIFFLGIIQYIWGLRAGDAGKAKIGGNFMLWGLIALFVMFSVYGIITFAQSVLLNGRSTSTITIPNININGSGTPTPNAGTGLNPLNAPTQNAATGVSAPTYNSNTGASVPTSNANTGSNSTGADCVTNADCYGLACTNNTCQSCPVGTVVSSYVGCTASVGGGGR